VELPKFKPQTISERKMQVLWLRFLTEINDKTQEAPAELLENAEVSEALEILERAAFTDAEMRAYDKFWDEVSSLRTIEGDWEDKLKEAEAKLKQDKLDTARKLKAMNVMTTAQIAEATGLTAEEIEAL
jgi:hypothetical protein